MALTFTTGNTFSNGDSATSLKLNNIVNLATYSGALEVAHGGTGGTTLFGSGQAWNNLGVNDGTQLHSSTSGLTVGNASSTTQVVLGQSVSNGLVLQWTYNATPSGAYGLITTFGQSNPIKVQSSTLSYDSGSQANCIQTFASGRTLFSAAGADDGVHFLQVQGGFGYDRAQSGITTISYSSTPTVDFNAGNENKTIALSGGVTFASANLAAARAIAVIITNASGSSQSLAFPAGWVFIGAAAPTTIANNKTAVLSLFSQTTSDSGVIAAYAVQP